MYKLASIALIAALGTAGIAQADPAVRVDLWGPGMVVIPPVAYAGGYRSYHHPYDRDGRRDRDWYWHRERDRDRYDHFHRYGDRDWDRH